MDTKGYRSGVMKLRVNVSLDIICDYQYDTVKSDDKPHIYCFKNICASGETKDQAKLNLSKELAKRL